MLEQSLETLGIVLDPNLPTTMAAGEPMDVPTKAGLQRLRPVLGEMAEHPSHLPITMQFPEWEARLEALRKAAPVEAQGKYNKPVVAAMFRGGAP